MAINIPQLAKKMWEDGSDPHTMAEMRNDLAEHGIASAKITDELCMKVDDELFKICKEVYGDSGKCGLLSDRPDRKNIPFDQLLDAYALAYKQDNYRVTQDVKDKLVSLMQDTKDVFWAMLREIESHCGPDDVLNKDLVRAAYRHWNRMHPEAKPLTPSFDGK